MDGQNILHCKTKGTLTVGRNRVRRVVVSFQVGIAERLAEASDDGLDGELGVVTERVGEDVAHGKVNRLLEEIVLEEDETGVDQAGVSGNVAPVVDHFSRGSQSSGNGEV